MSEGLRHDDITIQVTLDAKAFRRFAIFDTFVRQKRWRAPVAFAAILLAFSAVCFALRDRPQATLLGIVLLIVGLGLPAVYFGVFLSTLRGSVRKQKLPRPVYALTLSDAKEGVAVKSLTTADEGVTLSWDSLFAAYRHKDCIYLYAAPAKAFLLPDGQASVSPDDLWRFIADHLAEGKAFVR